jgi:hypothetical protein
VATGSDLGELIVWPLAGRATWSVQADARIVNCVAPHPTCAVLAVSGIDDTVKWVQWGVPDPAVSVRPRASLWSAMAFGDNDDDDDDDDLDDELDGDLLDEWGEAGPDGDNDDEDGDEDDGDADAGENSEGSSMEASGPSDRGSRGHVQGDRAGEADEAAAATEAAEQPSRVARVLSRRLTAQIQRSRILARLIRIAAQAQAAQRRAQGAGAASAETREEEEEEEEDDDEEESKQSEGPEAQGAGQSDQ